MKKTTAAAVAAAVGAALLLGGAGTLAYWSDTDSSVTQVISSGTLEIGAPAEDAGIWKDSADKTITNIVPGDTVTTVVNVPVTLTGENLKAELAVEKVDVGANPFSTKLDVSTSVGTGVDALELTSESVIPADGVPVTITVTLPFDATEDDIADMTKTLSFDLDYTLTQVQ
ncbi:MAG: alternate-type signal peptide domain-containing protein [Microbacterium sp.]